MRRLVCTDGNRVRPSIPESVVALLCVLVLPVSPEEVVHPPQHEPTFIRGDANVDARVNLTDAIVILEHLFLNRPPEPSCLDSCDVNDDDTVNLVDSVALLFWLFLAEDPYPGWVGSICQIDSSLDLLSCQSFGPCGTPPTKKNSIGQEMIYIAPGTFLMGSPIGELGRGQNSFYDETPHLVTIASGFYMSKTEVTQAQYLAVMGGKLPPPPDGYEDIAYPSGPELPAIFVTWDNAMRFCEKLSKTEATTYRLPTEAQWEYACRAGTTTRFSFGDGLDCPLDSWGCCPGSCGQGSCDAHEYMWTCPVMEHGYLFIRPVGLKKPNAWGLFDMHGNVHEWCLDWLGTFPKKAVINPTGPPNGDLKVMRGGFGLSFHLSRSAARAYQRTFDRGFNVGFRVVERPPAISDYVTPR